MKRHTTDTGHTVFEKMSKDETDKLTYEFMFDVKVDVITSVLESFLQGKHALDRPSIALAAETAIMQFITYKEIKL